MTDVDRIEKKIVLRATRARIWRALTNADEFGKWFGMALEGTFAVGSSVRGRITTPGYEHLTIEMTIERMDAETRLSYRWHPNAVDPKIDYSSEPTTLVEFQLDDVADGTLLTVVESGFDRIPAGRRDEAFRRNDEGWSGQLENIRRHVAG
ncbi:MAG TPA: SRPBCC family protein [Vicinamibacterales bacterium]|nr:SRPBCC family protein [Vicinamibacterales bacterium]